MTMTPMSLKTVSELVTNVPETVYTTPLGYSSIVTACQAANILGEFSIPFTMSLSRGMTTNNLIADYPVPPTEVLCLFGGSLGTLILEPGDSISVSGSILGEGSALNFTMSVIETLNNPYPCGC